MSRSVEALAVPSFAHALKRLPRRAPPGTDVVVRAVRDRGVLTPVWCQAFRGDLIVADIEADKLSDWVLDVEDALGVEIDHIEFRCAALDVGKGPATFDVFKFDDRGISDGERVEFSLSLSEEDDQRHDMNAWRKDRAEGDILGDEAADAALENWATANRTFLSYVDEVAFRIRDISPNPGSARPA
jgi:hypothetical protein